MTRDCRRDLARYAIGAALSAALTLLAFWAVIGTGITRAATLWIIGVVGILQIGVHLRCFLDISWRSKREDLQLILFSLFLMALMIGGTLWIMGSLENRMH